MHGYTCSHRLKKEPIGVPKHVPFWWLHPFPAGCCPSPPTLLPGSSFSLASDRVTSTGISRIFQHLLATSLESLPLLTHSPGSLTTSCGPSWCSIALTINDVMLILLSDLVSVFNPAGDIKYFNFFFFCLFFLEFASTFKAAALSVEQSSLPPPDPWSYINIACLVLLSRAPSILHCTWIHFWSTIGCCMDFLDIF